MAEKDNILVEKVLAGDRDLFGDLVERYTGLVHGILLEKIRRPDEVEDLVQDTFAQAYEQLATLREPAKFGPWIGRIAANMATDWLHLCQKRTRAEQTDQPLFLNRHIQQPDEHFEAREKDAILWEALAL